MPAITVYAIEQRQLTIARKGRTASIPQPIDSDWAPCSFRFAPSLNPYVGLGSTCRPLCSEATAEYEYCEEQGYTGWRTLQYAQRAIRRLQRDLTAGRYSAWNEHTGNKYPPEDYAFRITVVRIDPMRPVHQRGEVALVA